ncbi:unnamed protein product [Leptidea sinapis]|uniref:DDE Tnp4 domain-containing protein n=1 Tax=Leptidea sinapis TaxID=189913 RepID=A0A5E4QLD2_9NEOP|nr:unnamed protein product [Leptidea sinapis]
MASCYHRAYASLESARYVVQHYICKMTSCYHRAAIQTEMGWLSDREMFQEMGRHGRWPGLPGIDGAIDCTHVKIMSTPKCQHHEVYPNRKSYFSINVQVSSCLCG